MAATVQVARAENPQDRYWVRLEYFLPSIESSARLDPSRTAATGATLSMEDDLGLRDRKGTPYVLLGTRLGERWRLEFEYYRLRRSGSRILDRDIPWGDQAYSLSTRLDTEFESTVYRLVVGWSFLRSPVAEAGVALGLHATEFELALDGQTAIGSSASRATDRRDQLVPLPTVGLYGSYALSPHWVLRARLDRLSLSYKEYDGALTNLQAGVDWRFAKHWSLGVSYRLVHYSLELSRPRFDGALKYRFHGPSIHISATF
ncbi:MAG TPA: outer membrane beta-barrel protein [Burkholderiaceae bacterium]|nr:outer membrane beta-barrel protein [Burkholderiaceae bacterium]